MKYLIHVVQAHRQGLFEKVTLATISFEKALDKTLSFLKKAVVLVKSSTIAKAPYS